MIDDDCRLDEMRNGKNELGTHIGIIVTCCTNTVELIPDPGPPSIARYPAFEEVGAR